jgi:hypothetical protein
MNNSSTITVQVFDLTGNQVVLREFPPARLLNLSLENQPQGIYLVRVIRNDQTGIGKVIKE